MRLIPIFLLLASAAVSQIRGPHRAVTAAGGAGPAWVQNCTAASGSAGTATFACPSSVGSGHALVLTVASNTGACTGTGGVGGSPIGIGGDSQTWALATSAGDGSFSDVYVFYALNTASGSESATVTCNNGATEIIHIAGAEFSGLATSGSLDKTATGTYSFAVPASGTTATTAAANEVLIGGFGYALGDAVDPGSGWTLAGSQFDTGQNRSVFMEYKIVSATGAYQATTTDLGGTYAGAGVIATFK